VIAVKKLLAQIITVLFDLQQVWTHSSNKTKPFSVLKPENLILIPTKYHKWTSHLSINSFIIFETFLKENYTE
jgi:hypothetical protein